MNESFVEVEYLNNLNDDPVTMQVLDESGDGSLRFS